ncbi:hypothetical protein PVAP13_3NG178783 [Panicum virgatum]|uniref:Uncharacterized protein n=3 Tax=Panicum virgatum TaxID=38727 RepID=A0A8T0TY97_PANVG|nr:hypothetical protein PVAP13_3NG178783 [Panicum virgatum]
MGKPRLTPCCSAGGAVTGQPETEAPKAHAPRHLTSPRHLQPHLREGRPENTTAATAAAAAMWRRLQTLASSLRRAAAATSSSSARAAPLSTAPATFRRTSPLLSSPGDKPAPTKVEDVMPIATGLEREELEAELQGKKRFDMDPPVGPFGTKEPAVIESYYNKRIVGCPGGQGGHW